MADTGCLPRHAAGGACVAPGVRAVSIFFRVVPPEEPTSLRGSKGGYLLSRYTAPCFCWSVLYFWYPQGYLNMGASPLSNLGREVGCGIEDWLGAAPSRRV